MTELRTTFPLSESEEQIQVIAPILIGIDPHIQLFTEAAGKLLLVRILFPERTELDTFLSVLSEKGISLKKWDQHETDHSASEPVVE